MGSVYEAAQIGTNRRIAIKIVKNRMLPAGSDAAKRFRREARAASAVNNEHVVKVLDAGTDRATGLLYMVMEYLRGEDLQQHIDLNGPIAPDAVLRIAAQALLGLQKAHEAHIVHRDIKPANLFLAQRRGGEVTVKIFDFGIAKMKSDPLLVPQSTALTDASGFLGSPLYMSPEQVLNSRDVDHRTDLWSLASTLYCAFAGRAPHEQAGAVGKLIYTICSTPPRPLQEVAHWVPTEITQWLHGALQINPEARYPSAAAMLRALRPLLSSGNDALRETMLLPVSQRVRRAEVAAKETLLAPTVRRVVIDMGATGPVLGDDTTEEPDAPRPGGKRAKPCDAGSDALHDTTTQPFDAADTIEEENAASLLSTTDLGQTTVSEAFRGDGSWHHVWTRPRAAAIGAMMIVATGGAAMVWRTTRPAQDPLPVPTLPATLELSHAAPALPPPEPQAPASAAAQPAAPPAEIRRATLLVSPADALVWVDGVHVKSSSGAVEISGKLGSQHKVVVLRAGREKSVSVVVSEDGVSPSKVTLPSSKTAAPGGKTPPAPDDAPSAPAGTRSPADPTPPAR
jgi:eukaryotic-like serine/threonine-protein kinase